MVQEVGEDRQRGGDIVVMEMLASGHHALALAGRACAALTIFRTSAASTPSICGGQLDAHAGGHLRDGRVDRLRSGDHRQVGLGHHLVPAGSRLIRPGGGVHVGGVECRQGQLGATDFGSDGHGDLLSEATTCGPHTVTAGWSTLFAGGSAPP